ncbi:hypothetical protein BD770DRAFT_357012 [Pilaira anomala]|nr:hypothetical protein BD770DRAFT_357012 [Pilaira anomala]
MGERLFKQELQYDLVTPDGYEIVSEFISISCISILSFTMGLKTYGERIKALSYGRILVILLYASSWAFSTLSVIVVSTNNNNLVSCTIGMLGCDIFYAGSKIVIYAWLIERVYLVTAVKTVRMKTKEYKMHLLLLCPYIVIFALMMTFRNIYLEPNGECTMGLTRVSSIPLMVYDFFFNCYLTWLFIRPLTGLGRRDPKLDWKRSRLYKLARRTLVASIVCLTVSFCNVGYVVISNGHQRGLICLTMCTVDVTVNVVTVHWVTTGNSRSKPNQDEQVTAELTIHEDRFTTMRFGAQQQPIDYDDDTSSNNSSTADVSHSSRKPMNLF